MHTAAQPGGRSAAARTLAKRLPGLVRIAVRCVVLSLPCDKWHNADLCVQEGNECVTMSATFSQCKPCNSLYEQCGGTIPGTNLPWSEHGRPSCCAGSQPSACQYVNGNFYQCKPL